MGLQTSEVWCPVYELSADSSRCAKIFSRGCSTNDLQSSGLTALFVEADTTCAYLGNQAARMCFELAKRLVVPIAHPSQVDK